MAEFLATVTFWATVAYAAASMLSVGLRFSLRRVLRPLKNADRSVRAIAANFVVAPLFAFGVGILLDLPLADRIGLFLLGVGAGAPFFLKLSGAAKADMEQTTALLVLLLVGSILYMPIILPFAFQNARFETSFSALSIARPLVLNMLVPLGAGFVVRRYAPSFARRASPLLSQAATFALVALIGSTVLGNFREVVGLIASPSFLAVLLFVAGSFFFGWWMAPTERSEPVFALGTGQRNVAAAAVVAEESFGSPEVVVMVVIGAVLAFSFLFPAAFQIRKRIERSETAARARLQSEVRPFEQTGIEHPYRQTVQPPPARNEPPRQPGERP